MLRTGVGTTSNLQKSKVLWTKTWHHIRHDSKFFTPLRAVFFKGSKCTCSVTVQIINSMHDRT